MFYVYEWIRLDTNEPFYVGKGIGNRCYSFNGRNQYFKNVVNKVGIENIAVSFLHRDLTEQEAFLMEKFYIYYYKNSLGLSLTNMTDGGEGVSGLSPSIETKMKISKNRKGKMTGSENHNFGKPLSEETKQKLRDTRLGEKSIWYNVRGSNHPAHGYRHTKEAKRKISEASIGRKKSEETIKKLKDRHGEKNPMYGKTHTPEARKSMGEKRSGANNWMSKKVQATFPDGSDMLFDCLTAAVKYFKNEFGVSQKPINHLLESGLGWDPRWKKHYNLKGLKFKYVGE